MLSVVCVLELHVSDLVGDWVYGVGSLVVLICSRRCSETVRGDSEQFLVNPDAEAWVSSAVLGAASSVRF